MEPSQFTAIQEKSPRLIDADGVAELLHVPKSWVYERTRRGTIPMLRLGKYIRFDAAQILRWAESGCPER